MTPRVKICGVTRAEDAELATALGAAAIGFVFWPESPRCVVPSRARAIVAALPPFVAAVGVFVNATADEVAKIAGDARLSAIQLHGGELVRDFSHLPWPIIKAVAVRRGRRPPELRDVPSDVPVLLDAFDTTTFGGTGRPIDWQVAAAIAAERPVILSGGLGAENVADAIATVAPLAVDVSSGVESSPGVKDAGRLRAFFAAVEGARS